MGLVAAKCTECGAAIKVDETQERGLCEYCGAEYITEKVINNYTTNYNVTNNITKVVNENDADLEEEILARALNHKKLGNKTEAQDEFAKLTKKYPSVAEYHKLYALALSDDFKTLFFEKPETSPAHKELNSFFKTAKKEDLETFCKEYGVKTTENVAKIKEELLVYSQNEYVEKVLIPAYKNKTVEEKIFNKEIKPATYENIVKLLTPENIEKARKHAISYLEYVKEEAAGVEIIIYEEERELTDEEQEKLDYYTNLSKLIEKINKKYKLVEIQTEEQIANLAKLEEELDKKLEEKEKQNAKRKAKKDILYTLGISFYCAIPVVIISYFIFYSKLAKEVENKFLAPLKDALIVGAISILVVFSLFYLFRWLGSIKKKVNEKTKKRAKAKADKEFQKFVEKQKIKEEASKRIIEKIGLKAAQQMVDENPNRYSALIDIEVEKMKAEENKKK